jgi:uncharacterized membrane protein YcaP (DUF421 family)
METVLRIAIIYVVILVALRVMGKREFGQLTPLELVSLLLIPDLITQAALGEDYSLTSALVAVLTLLGLVFITSIITFLSPKAENLLAGKPALLVAHGKLQARTLDRERVTPAEIFAEMHRAGLERLEQVRWAVLEDDGRIAVVPEPEAQDQHHSADQKSAL